MRAWLERLVVPVAGHLVAIFAAVEDGSTIQLLLFLLVAAGLLAGRAGYKGRPLWEAALIGAWPPLLFEPFGFYGLFNLGKPSFQLWRAFQALPPDAALPLLGACALLAAAFGWSFGRLRRVEGR